MSHIALGNWDALFQPGLGTFDSRRLFTPVKGKHASASAEGAVKVSGTFAGQKVNIDHLHYTGSDEAS